MIFRWSFSHAAVTTHDDVDLDSRKCAVVEAVTEKGTGNKACCGTKSGGVVIENQIVIDCFGNVESPQLITGLLGHFGNDAAGIGAVIESVGAVAPEANHCPSNAPNIWYCLWGNDCQLTMFPKQLLAKIVFKQ